MDLQFLSVFLLLALGGWAAWYLNKLTAAASVAGVIIGLLIYQGAGLAGVLMLAAFFTGGTFVTKWKAAEKTKLHPAEFNQPRTAGQVIANGGVAALTAFLAVFYEIPAMLLVASAFSSATADTFSSELGNVYGKKYFNILTFKHDQRGLDGVVSLEGLLAGLIGSLIIAAICIAFTSSPRDFILVIIAGTAGNLADSILGATLERKKMIGNDAVNLLNTLIAVLLSLSLTRII